MDFDMKATNEGARDGGRGRGQQRMARLGSGQSSEPQQAREAGPTLAPLQL